VLHVPARKHEPSRRAFQRTRSDFCSLSVTDMVVQIGYYTCVSLTSTFHDASTHAILYAALDETFFCAFFTTGNTRTFDSSPIT
jgi:hypothetical protein